MAGIPDDDLWQKILTQTMMGTVNNLPTLLEFAASEEAATVKTPVQSIGAIQNKKTRNDKKCIGCGGDAHGPFNRRKALECKAFGKQCAKCGKPNHYTNLCRSKVNGLIQQNPQEDPEVPTVSGFISAIGATPLTNPRSSAATLAALKSHSAGPVNTLPVAHHVYDKFMKTWSKRSPKPSPTV